MVEYFNFYYFLYVALALALLFGLYFLLRNKSERTAHAVLLALLLFNFVMHFLKLAFDFYQELMPWVIRTVTPENICAVSVMIFPWFFLSKKSILRDYMFFMGMISGIGATMIPVDVLGHNAFEFETIRFYFAHVLIWVIPLLMVMLKLHTLDYKRIIKIPVIAYMVMCIILVNEVFLSGAGFVNPDHLFSYEVRNASLIFGPNPQIGFLGDLFKILTPELFTTVPIGPNAGEPFYWPIVWLIIPSYIYFCIVSLLLALPFDHKRIRSDISNLLKSHR